MSDIVERLRDPRFSGFVRDGIASEAAAEIERLRAEDGAQSPPLGVQGLRRPLRPDAKRSVTKVRPIR